MYTEMKKLYDETHPLMWNMAMTHLMDIGYREATQITDEDIAQIEGNAMMTQDFVQGIVRTARDIARNSTPLQLIQFNMVEKCVSTQGYKPRTYKSKAQIKVEEV